MILNLNKFDPETGRQIVYDASSLHDLKLCKRLFQLSYLEQWRRRTGKGIDMQFGTATHEGLAEYDRLVAAGESHECAQQAAVGVALRNACGLEASEDTKKNLSTLTRLIVWYTEQFKEDPLQTVIFETGEPALEVRFEVPIPNTHYWFSGYVDKLVKYEDEYYVLERKTTKWTLGDDYFLRYSPDTQVSAYVWALREALDFPIKGAFIDAIQTAVTFTRCIRRPIPRTKSQLDEWLRDTLWHIQVAESCYDNDYWPQNDAACALYGGCKFRSVCGRTPEIRRSFLEGEFEQRPSRRKEVPTVKLERGQLQGDVDSLC